MSCVNQSIRLHVPQVRGRSACDSCHPRGSLGDRGISEYEHRSTPRSLGWNSSLGMTPSQQRARQLARSARVARSVRARAGGSYAPVHAGPKAASMSPSMEAPDFNLTGRVALITGAGRGIGLGIAHALASAGCAIAIQDLDEDIAQREAAAIVKSGGRA